MRDNNAKAPKVRSGDNINPVLGSIIKISAIVVIAALIVLITLVTIKLIQNKQEPKPIFDDEIRLEISSKEFQEITSPNVNLENLAPRIKSVIEAHQNEYSDQPVMIYFYFYYSADRKELLKDKKDEIKAINALPEGALLFIVDLSEQPGEEETGIVDVLKNDKRLNTGDIEFNTILTAQDSTKKGLVKRYTTILLPFNFEEVAGGKPFSRPANDRRGDKENTVIEMLNKVVPTKQ